MMTVSHSAQVLQGLFTNIAAPEALLFMGSLLWVLFVPVLEKTSPPPASLSRLIARVSLAVALAFAGLIVLGLASRQVHNWHWRMLLPFASLCFALALAWLLQQLQILHRERRSARAAAFLGTALIVLLMATALNDGYQSFRVPAKQPRESLLQLGQIERVYAAAELDAERAPWTLVTIGSPPEQSYARSLPLTLQRVLSPRSPLVLVSNGSDWLNGPVLYYLEGPTVWIEELSASLDLVALSPLLRGSRFLAWRVGTREQALAIAESICALSEGVRLRVDSPRDQFALLEMVGLATDSGESRPLSEPVSCLRLAP